MIETELFREILVAPVESGCDKLLVISGYATSAMVFHHLEYLKKQKQTLEIELIVGMAGQDGVAVSNHKGFKKIMDQDYSGKFICSYVHQGPPVHSKVYIWMKKGRPAMSFLGSANYSQIAFNVKPRRVGAQKKPLQKEVLTSSDPKKSFEYFQSIIPDTIYCNHFEVENYITVFSESQYFRRSVGRRILQEETVASIGIPLPCVTVPLVMRNGQVHPHSGLNWAFRKKYTRKNRNEAYIQLRPHIYKGDFFPPKGVHFTIHTDDGKSLICTRAQKRFGEAIETPHDNGLLGEYFRNRLGLAYGSKVTRAHLDGYGRSDVEFCKVDDENYNLSFAV